ncbi:MAG TPA: hypothetical protein VK518_22030 [Puia sp.]|nr:hypothetical protein [Puia sp.]
MTPTAPQQIKARYHHSSFRFSRWILLIKKHWAENSRRYLLSLLAIAGLQIAWYSFILAMDKYDPLDTFFQYSAYFVGLYLVGCLYANSLFTALSSRKEGLGYLALPASQLEKLLCTVLFGVVFFFISFTLLFYLVDIPMVQFANHLIVKYPRFIPDTNQLIQPVKVYNIFTAEGGMIPEKNFHTFLLGYFAVQSAFLLGSVYFTRYSFIKTVVYALLFMLVFVVFQSQILQYMLPDGWHTDLTFWHKGDFLAGEEQIVRLSSLTEKLFIYLAFFSLPPIFWVIAYYRLKEKEL